MAFTLPLALIGVGVLIYLLFGAATYALPMMAGVCAAFASIHAGVSGPTAILLGLAVFEAVIAIGRKAMPVILMREDHERWLTGDMDEVLALQAAYPSQLMAVA